jgi:hypothetical protein
MKEGGNGRKGREERKEGSAETIKKYQYSKNKFSKKYQ